MDKDPIVIVSAARTPIGNFQGCLKQVTAPQLGAAAIKGSLERAGFPSPYPLPPLRGGEGVGRKHHEIQEVLMGCVLPAGLGQAPARQAALLAGLSDAVACTTVNKMCGSGMKTVMLGHDILSNQAHDIIIAGGMESMTNAPYLLPKARAGYRLGHQTALDHMLYDGLEDAYQKGSLMGVFAEDCAAEFGFTRDAQDAFAITSVKRAQQATEDGSYSAEIVPITVATQEGETVILHDEGPSKARLEKIPHLKPSFRADGTITPANSSSISDGAAALMLMRRSQADKRGLTPLASIVAHSSHAQAPHLFTTAPIGAIKRLLSDIHWSVDDVDLFEINEAFAVVAMAAMKALNLPHEKVNVHGGACVLGHPIGASGARILVTLIYALRKYGLKRGVAALCIGGGEATAMAVEVG